MATRFNFVKVPTINLASQLAFYEAAFGFARYADFDGDALEEILMRQEGSDFLLVLMRFKQGMPAGAQSAIGTIGFVTEDIDAALQRALEGGATIKQPMFEVEGTKVALVDDPEGNEIEFVQFG